MGDQLRSLRVMPTRSNSADHCWHVCYQFCDLSAEITVYAENEVDARAKAIDQLRRRSLKVA